ncbi:MAG: BTAD domain-containing putative transcriptional regulator [Terrabacter sp.]
MRIAVLGPLCVDGDPGRLSRRDRVVLSVLTIRRPGFVTPAELAEALWPVQPPSSWAKVIQGCVMRLRRELGSETIVTSPTGYRLAVDDDDVDAASFERAVERAGRLVESGDVGRAHALLESAVGLWRGQPLPDLSGWPPGEIEASRLDVVGAEAKELLVEAGIGTGRAAAVLPLARVLVDEVPASEHRAALLARAQYLGDDQAQALTTLRSLRRHLRDEGLEPREAIGRLERAILAQDPDLDIGVQARTTVWERPSLPRRWGSEGPTVVVRRHDLDSLEEAWQAVTRGARGVALVGGAPGARTSRLVAEVERLAHHYAAAHSTGHRDTALTYLREAARLATGRLAHADASALLERAVELSTGTDDTDELRLDASAASCRAGDYEAARRHASVVLSSADPHARLRGAIAYEDAAFRGGKAAEDTVERMQSALDSALTADPPMAPDDPLVIRARASLARTLGQGIRLDERGPVFAELIRSARQSGDESVLAHVLESAVLLPAPESAKSAEVRLARARELGDIGRRIGDSDALTWSAMSRAVAAYVLGRPDEMREAKAAAHAAARISGTATAEQVVLCQGYARAMELGDLDRAEALASDAGDISQVTGRLEGAIATQRFLVERERLTVERMRPLVSGEERSTDVWAPGRLALYRELGMRRPARRLLGEALAHGLAPWRTLGTWELALVFFTECIVWLADRELALEVRSSLELLSGHSVVLGPMTATFGAADRYLGSVEALLGSPRSDELLQRAVELDRSMDAPLHRGYSLVALLGSRQLAGRSTRVEAALRQELEELALRLAVPRLSAAVVRLSAGRGTVQPSG